MQYKHDIPMSSMSSMSLAMRRPGYEHEKWPKAFPCFTSDLASSLCMCRVTLCFWLPAQHIMLPQLELQLVPCGSSLKLPGLQSSRCNSCHVNDCVFCYDKGNQVCIKIRECSNLLRPSAVGVDRSGKELARCCERLAAEMFHPVVSTHDLSRLYFKTPVRPD